MCVGSIIGVSGYRQKLLAASRDGAKGGQQGRAHAIIPAHSMQGGALMDCVDGGSDDEEVGTHPSCGCEYQQSTGGIQLLVGGLSS